MSMPLSDFQSFAQLRFRASAAYANRTTDMNAIITALGTDTVVHDVTIDNAVAALAINRSQTPFANEMNLLVNKGKAGNLSAANMATALTAVLAAG